MTKHQFKTRKKAQKRRSKNRSDQRRKGFKIKS